MAKIDIRDYEIKYTDQFFFDTNVWILLFGTIANYEKNDQKVYSEFLRDLVQQETPIYISSIILSEFANVLLRYDFKQWQTSNQLINKNFKTDFVGTPDYENSIQVIKTAIKKIFSIPNLTQISDNFHIVDMDEIFKYFGEIDYNDSYIYHICCNNKYKLITNDKDFYNVSSNIDIITTK